jgi:hypothetical protein
LAELRSSDRHVSRKPSTNSMNGMTRASRNKAAFDPKLRKRRCSATPAASAISRVVVLR